MRVLPPRDNAFFLLAWRERMRPATVLTASVLAVAATSLILIGSFSASDADDVGNALKMLSVLQGFVLFIVGSYQVGRVAARERESGTIDFHRSSPTSRVNQVLGIIIGAPVLEWCVFGATLLVSFVLLPMSRVGVGTFLGLYISMIISALFFHSLAAALALARGDVKKTVKGNAMGVVPVVALLIAGPVAIGLRASTLFHASSIPAYAGFFREAVPPWGQSGGNGGFLLPVLYSAFGVRLPSIVLQLAVQIPLGVLAWIASMRVVTNPERPILSKRQLLFGAGHILLLVIASATSCLGAADTGWRRPDPSAAAAAFMLVAFAVGAAGAYATTPGQLLHLKGLKRARKLGRSGLAPLDDAASNWTWLAIYCLLVGGAYAVLIGYFDTDSAFAPVGGVVVVLSWCVWFGGALEYFRLGPHRKSGSLFAVAIFLLWFFLPMLGVVLGWAGVGGNVAVFYATSPFIGLPGLADAATNGDGTAFLGVALAVNLTLAIATMLLAARTRGRLAERCAAEPAESDAPAPPEATDRT